MSLIIFLVLAVPVFFVVKWIFDKINPSRNSLKNPFLWLTTIVVTPIIYIGLIYTWILLSTYYPERDFDKEAWANNREKRYEYADDLVDNHKLIGLSKKDVIEMLGEPESENDSTIKYYIGYSPRHIISIDPDYLEISFKGGKAWKTIIYQI